MSKYGDSDIKETSQTWNKLVTTAKKAGFREGAIAGRNEVFQNSFDNGYFEGFKNAMVLGKYKGSIRSFSLELDPTLKDVRKAWCQICEDKMLLESTTKEIIEKQTQHSNALLENLHSKYCNDTRLQII